MKPYRGRLLASAVLIATLPFSGCGEADDWKKTTEIVLSTSTPTVEVNGDAIFTVRSPPPTEGYACDTALQYRAQGAGQNNNIWNDIPGAESTRVFKLRPREEGTLSVLSRGKCVDAKEDWKYSNQVDVAVSEQILPIVSGVTLTADPNPVTGGVDVVLTLSVTKDADCTLELQTRANGNTYSNDILPMGPGTFLLQTYPVVSATNLTVTTTAWCSENTTDIKSATVTISVTP